jgi:hypothetical protein
VDQQIATELPQARIAIRRYLSLCDRTLLNRDNLIDRMRAENTAKKRAGHHNLLHLEDHEVLRLQTAAVWPAWNIVEGPQSERRSDDPGEHQVDRFTSGLTPQEATRMREAELLFRSFRLFVGAGQAPGPERLDALARVAANVRPFLVCDSPVYYRSDMWIEDRSVGLWQKRRNSEADTSGSQARSATVTS